MTPQSKVTFARADAKPEKPVLRLKDLEPGTWFVFVDSPGEIRIRETWETMTNPRAGWRTRTISANDSAQIVRVIDVHITWSEQE